MKRTQIQLEDEQSRALHRRAAESSKSVALLIREAVDVYLARASIPHKPLAGLAGKFKRVSHKDLKDHDRGWADSIR
jgi:hypothetical protein